MNIDNDIYYWTHMLDESNGQQQQDVINNDFYKETSITTDYITGYTSTGYPCYIKNIIDCSGKQLEYLPNGCPKQIGNEMYKVTFDCSNNNLKNLNGSPEIVYGNFDCSENQLTSLEGCPKEIHGDLIIQSCEQLTSLANCATIVDGVINVNSCSLQNLDGCPKKCQSLYANNNQLTSLIGSPDTIIEDFYCCHNTSLKSLKGCTKYVPCVFNCSNCALITLLEGPENVGFFDISVNPQLKSLKGAPAIISRINTLGTNIAGVQVDNYLSASKIYYKILKTGLTSKDSNFANIMIDGHYNPVRDTNYTRTEDHVDRILALRRALFGKHLQTPAEFQSDQIVKGFREYRKTHPKK